MTALNRAARESLARFPPATQPPPSSRSRGGLHPAGRQLTVVDCLRDALQIRRENAIRLERRNVTANRRVGTGHSPAGLEGTAEVDALRGADQFDRQNVANVADDAP